MGRTTPPPPVDITGVFAELDPLGRRALRLHPRTGGPGPNDSSLGGPLLWPAGEAWPACQEPHCGFERVPAPPEITSMDQAARWAMATPGISMVGREGNGPIYGEQRRCQPPDVPAPMIGVLQLYARDVPDLPFPEHTDLFQLLWCPNSHDAPWYGPRPVTVWRWAAKVTEPLAAPPAGRFDDDMFARDWVPLPCRLYPEPVIEYPHLDDLPDELDERIRQWDERNDGLYWAALSTAPGTKVGGHPRWIQDPQWPQCRCGRRMQHLLTIASDEFRPEERWLPVEDRDDPRITGRRSIVDQDCWAPHGIMLGDVGSLYLFTCSACAPRPLSGTMQCS